MPIYIARNRIHGLCIHDLHIYRMRSICHELHEHGNLQEWFLGRGAGWTKLTSYGDLGSWRGKVDVV